MKGFILLMVLFFIAILSGLIVHAFLALRIDQNLFKVQQENLITQLELRKKAKDYFLALTNHGALVTNFCDHKYYAANNFKITCKEENGISLTQYWVFKDGTYFLYAQWF